MLKMRYAGVGGLVKANLVEVSQAGLAGFWLAPSFSEGTRGGFEGDSDDSWGLEGDSCGIRRLEYATVGYAPVYAG